MVEAIAKPRRCGHAGRVTLPIMPVLIGTRVPRVRAGRVLQLPRLAVASANAGLSFDSCRFPSTPADFRVPQPPALARARVRRVVFLSLALRLQFGWIPLVLRLRLEAVVGAAVAALAAAAAADVCRVALGEGGVNRLHPSFGDKTIGKDMRNASYRCKLLRAGQAVGVAVGILSEELGEADVA